MISMVENENEEEHLINMLQEETEKIEILRARIDNNLNVFNIGERNDPIEQQLVENESLLAVLIRNKSGISNPNVSKEKRDENFSKDLEIELKCLCNDLSKLTNRISSYEQSASRMSKTFHHLEEMMKVKQNGTNKEDQIQSIANNVNKRFKVEKGHLKLVIDSLFPEQMEVQDLIANVVDCYFSEGHDKYYTVEAGNGVSELIETLISTTLFELNPRDSLQIKMADLL